MKNEDAAWCKTNQTYSIQTCCRFARRWNHRRVSSCTNGLRHRHLLCFMHRFLKSSRAEHQQEVSSVSGEVILSPRGDATSICPITGQPSLAPISVTRIAIGAILRWTFPLRGALRAYPVPLKMTRSVRTMTENP